MKIKKLIWGTILTAASAASFTIARRTLSELASVVDETDYSHCGTIKAAIDTQTFHTPEQFTKGDLRTACGVAVYDLSNLSFPQESELFCNVHMGMMTVIIPSGVNVELNGKTFLGNSASLVPHHLEPQAPILRVKTKTYMGAFLIKAM